MRKEQKRQLTTNNTETELEHLLVEYVFRVFKSQTASAEIKFSSSWARCHVWEVSRLHRSLPLPVFGPTLVCAT